MESIVLLFALMGVTQLARLSPLFIKIDKIPDFLNNWLKQIPVSLIAAMTFPQFVALNPSQRLTLKLDFIFAALVTLVLLKYSKNLLLGLIGAVGAIVLFRSFMN